MIKRLYGFLSDYWRLLKDYITVYPSDASRWDSLTEDVEALKQKYNGNKAEDNFYKALLIALLDFFNDIEKNNRQGIE